MAKTYTKEQISMQYEKLPNTLKETMFNREERAVWRKKMPAKENQKVVPNIGTTFGGLRLVQAPSLSSNTIIAKTKILSRDAMHDFGTMEVAGIEPATPSLINQSLSQSTPTAFIFYHDTVPPPNS